MSASPAFANVNAATASLGTRPDLGVVQRGALWCAVLAVHAGAAVWAWRAASAPLPLSPQSTIEVVMLDLQPASPAAVNPLPSLTPPTPVKPAVTPMPASPSPRAVTPPSPTVAATPGAVGTVTAAPSPLAQATPAAVEAVSASPATPPSLAPTAAPAPVNAPPATPKTLPSSAVRYLVPPVLNYPRASRELGESGVVRLRVLVDEQGRPRDVEVTKSSGFPRLDQAASTAMRNARFQPHIEDGQPRMVWVLAPMNFQLDDL